MFLSNPPQVVARRLPVMTYHQHHQVTHHPHNVSTLSSFYPPNHMENQNNYQSNYHHNHPQFTYHQQQIANEKNQSLIFQNSPIHPRLPTPNTMYNTNWGEVPIQTRNNIYGNGNKSNEHG